VPRRDTQARRLRLRERRRKRAQRFGRASTARACFRASLEHSRSTASSQPVDLSFTRRSRIPASGRRTVGLHESGFAQPPKALSYAVPVADLRGPRSGPAHNRSKRKIGQRDSVLRTRPVSLVSAVSWAPGRRVRTRSPRLSVLRQLDAVPGRDS